MKKPLAILIYIGVILMVAAVLYRHSTLDHSSYSGSIEPRYQGERLSYWLQHLYSYDFRGQHINPAAADALQYSGVDALPLLLDWISRPAPTFTPGAVDFQRHAVDGFEILGPIAKPAIPKLMNNVAKGSYHSMQALEFIGRDAVPALTNKLLQTLADKRAPVMNWRHPGYKKNFFHVQTLIIRGLREMGTNAEAAIPALKMAMYANHGWRGEDNPYAAFVSVGQNHPEIVIPALIDVLDNADAPAINRGAVASAIALLGTNHADVFLPHLIGGIGEKRTDHANRRTMAGALALVGQNHPDLVVPVLIEAFTNTAVEYRDGIADALASFGEAARPALPLLLTASQSQYFYLREKAAVAVKKIAPERTNSLATLIQDLNNREPGYRQQAVYTLGRLGTNGAEAVPALMECLSHPDTQTRIDAARALNKIGVTSDEFISAMGENLSCTNYFMAGEARETLARFAPTSRLAFVTLIKRGVRGPVSRDVRFQAKWALVQASRQDATFLLDCLDDSDVALRSGSLAVFYELAQRVPQAIPKLKELARHDPDPSVRNLAAEVLKLQLE